MVLVIGCKRRTVRVEAREAENVVIGATAMTDVARPDGVCRRVRLRFARTGNACARASLTTDARTGPFDSGEPLPVVVFVTRSPRSHTDSGAENGKTISAISQQAAVRAVRESDIFV